jgi:hypothetical protein
VLFVASLLAAAAAEAAAARKASALVTGPVAPAVIPASAADLVLLSQVIA